MSDNPDFATYPPLPGERVGMFLTTGDNDFVYSAPPICSKASIDELYDVLKKVYKVQRIYWRAINEDQVLDYSLIRKDSTYHDYWMWSRHLNRDVGTANHGIEAAKARGMEVWGFLSLFDHGSKADMHYPKDSGPSMFEWKKRIENPEWVPVDKHGLRHMAGAVCFEYPEARKALVDMYVELATRSKYDGVLFYLYVEAFHSRFDDEFGFNKPIVDEFKKRYDVDITKDDYDVHALSQMRGEYLTQFFRELKAALKPHNIKVGITLSPNNPDYPQTWSASPEMLSSGRISVDWRRYIKELVAGGTSINDFGLPYMAMDLPFGGVKGSGFGRLNGKEGLRACCNEKSVLLDRLPMGAPSKLYPIGTFDYDIARETIRSIYGRGAGKAVDGVSRLLRTAWSALRQRD